MPLFHPADGSVRVEGATSCPNAVPHGWPKKESTAVLVTTPAASASGHASRTDWERWQDGLAVKPALLRELPPSRMLPVLDDLAGHKTPEFDCWMSAHGVMPLHTPVGGSWPSMAESIQRDLKCRALAGPSTR